MSGAFLNRPDSRAGDELMLEDHDLLATLKSGEVQRRFGLTPGQVAGFRSRYLRGEGKQGRCACTKPENRDGGMPARWWAA